MDARDISAAKPRFVAERCARIDTPHSPPFRTGEYITLLVETPE